MHHHLRLLPKVFQVLLLHIMLLRVMLVHHLPVVAVLLVLLIMLRLMFLLVLHGLRGGLLLLGMVLRPRWGGLPLVNEILNRNSFQLRMLSADVHSEATLGNREHFLACWTKVGRRLRHRNFSWSSI